MSGTSIVLDSSSHARMRKKASDGAKKYLYVPQHISLPSMTFIHISEEERSPDMKAESESTLYRKPLLLFIVQ